mgnify:FL=1
MEYKNTEEAEIKLSTTITLSNNKAEEILAQLKESGMKFIFSSDENKTSITFSIEDLEKMSKILSPYNQNELDTLTIPKADKKENLIPFFNAVSNIYDRKINGTVKKADAHRRHVDVLQKAVEEVKNEVERLTNRNDMLKGFVKTFPVFKSPINALIARNSKKIERLKKKGIPKLENQIQIHQNTIDKLNKRTEKQSLRKGICKNLNSVIKSFGISNKDERNIQYLSSMSALNSNIQQLTSEKMNNCLESMEKIKKEYPKLKTSSEQLKMQNTYENLRERRNKFDSKLNFLQSAQSKYENMMKSYKKPETTAAVDKAEKVIDESISKPHLQLGNVVDLCVDSGSIVFESAEINKLYLDKDGDLIPDRIDNSFSVKTDTPKKKEERYFALVTESEIEYLKEVKFPFYKCRKKEDDNRIQITFPESSKAEFDKLIQPIRKKRKNTAPKQQTAAVKK